jgi:16S rRNA (guanine527-N7)-methyltransferase
MSYREILIQGSRSYGIELDEVQVEQFILYKDLLKEWNEKINLTAITEDEDIIKKHFIDSISIAKSGLFKEGMKIIDVGTGAGFPGIPIKIIYPGIDVCLLDSLNKRINYLNEVIEKLQLKGISTIHGRAEDIARKPEFRESFNIATARAVANMAVLSEYCIPFVKTGGYFAAMKGPSVDEELKESKNAIGTLGGRLVNIINTEIPGEEMEHKIVIVEKVSSTIEKYPRKPAQIEKKPIR